MIEFMSTKLQGLQIQENGGKNEAICHFSMDGNVLYRKSEWMRKRKKR